MGMSDLSAALIVGIGGIAFVLMLGWLAMRKSRPQRLVQQWHAEARALGLEPGPAFFGFQVLTGERGGLQVQCNPLARGAGVASMCRARFRTKLRLGLMAGAGPTPADAAHEHPALKNTAPFDVAALPNWQLRAADADAAREVMERLRGLADVARGGRDIAIDDDGVTITAPFSPGAGSIERSLADAVRAAGDVASAWRSSPRAAWERALVPKWRELATTLRVSFDEPGLRLHGAVDGVSVECELRRALVTTDLETGITAKLPSPPACSLMLSAASDGIGMVYEVMGVAKVPVAHAGFAARFSVASSAPDTAATVMTDAVCALFAALPAGVASANVYDGKLVLTANEALSPDDIERAVRGAAHIANALARR